MLSDAQKKQLDALLQSATPEQRLAMVHYIAGTEHSAPATGPLIPVYFATETGNSKRVAQELTAAAKARGIRMQAQPFNKIDLAALAKQPHAIFISATHGEGDPPEAAVKFFKALEATNTATLQNLRIATLGLGDRSYKEFCKAAVDVQAHLQRLGAQAFHPITLLDVDFDEHTQAWFDAVLGALLNAAPATVRPAATKPKSTVGYSRLSPITGRVLDIVNLNDRGSNKETYHIELSFDADIEYQPGDAAGILLPDAPEGYTPRLYSIASSQAVFENALHLTVAHAKHEGGFGICSHYLAGLREGDEVQFYIHRNSRFRLPAPDAPIIMIGPGTGIAPFRGFVQERDALGASGENWLLFGDQHAHTDFLYQLEWQDYLASGALHQLDLAFSRDQKEKVYVQHKLQQKAQQFVAWLERGAHLYVCGAKSPMSEDVEATVLQILQTEKSWSAQQATEYLEQLTEDNRYVKDVY